MSEGHQGERGEGELSGDGQRRAVGERRCCDCAGESVHGRGGVCCTGLANVGEEDGAVRVKVERRGIADGDGSQAEDVAVSEGA